MTYGGERCRMRHRPYSRQALVGLPWRVLEDPITVVYIPGYARIEATRPIYTNVYIL